MHESIQNTYRTLEEIRNQKSRYVDSIDAEIDNSLVDLIKLLNEDTPFETQICCSGTLDDHYDIQTLKQEVTPTEFAQVWQDNTRQFLTQDPYIHFEPHFHTRNENTIQYDVEYHRFRNVLNTLTIKNKYYETELDIAVDYEHDMVGYDLFDDHELGYMTLQVNMKPTNWMKHEMTFEEINEQLHGVIALLTEFFTHYDHYMEQPPDELYYDCESSSIQNSQ